MGVWEAQRRLLGPWSLCIGMTFVEVGWMQGRGKGLLHFPVLWAPCSVRAELCPQQSLVGAALSRAAEQDRGWQRGFKELITVK